MTFDQLRRLKPGDVLRYTWPDGRPSFRVRVDHNGPYTVAGEVVSGPDNGKRWLSHHDSAGSATAVSRLTKLKRSAKR